MKAALALFLMFTAVTVAEVAGAQEIYPFYRDIRAQGMGGAGVATVNDPSSLFVNPAGLGKIRGPYFSLLNAELETNYDTQSALTAGNNSANITNPQTLLNIAQQNPNKHLHALVQTLPAFVTTNFGIGLLGKYSVDAEFKSATNLMHLDYFNDYALAMGYCVRLLSGVIKIGVVGKVVNRVYASQDIAANSTITMSQIAAEGTGIGWDGSVMLSAPVSYLPSITAVAHDIGTTKFTMGNGYFYKTGVTPPPQPQSVDVGFAVFPIMANRTRLSITGEYRDVQNPENVDVYRRVHGGIEINFGDILFLRGGMNQRYYTAGIEWDFFHNQLQLATYGEEIGTPTNFREDRRFALEYSFRF